MRNEIKSTAHSKYRCQYHIVFAPKYRRKVIYKELRADIGQIIRKLCEEKKVEIIEAQACPDHIHMLVSIPPYLSVAQFVGFLKSKSALMVFDRHANLKYKYGRRNFWARGYFVDTVGRNEKAIKEYIKNQLEELENRKIWLKCGGFITIDKTEALTAIDVNTGKYIGGANKVEQTIYKVNMEATIEIAKQLRLKDIGGIIIIDYIDMLNKEDKEKIEELLKKELKKDRTKTQVEGFTKLDLMELTRKHICSHKE